MQDNPNLKKSGAIAAVVIAALLVLAKWATPQNQPVTAEDLPATDDVVIEEVDPAAVELSADATVKPTTAAPTSKLMPVSPALATVAPKVESTAQTSASAASRVEPVTAAVSQWAKCWSNQDVACYLAAYSTIFAPENGSSLDNWKKTRTRKLTAPKSIALELGPLQFLENTSTEVAVQFEQAYRSPTYADNSLKTLVLMKESSGWKIIREASVARP